MIYLDEIIDKKQLIQFTTEFNSNYYRYSPSRLPCLDNIFIKEENYQNLHDAGGACLIFDNFNSKSCTLFNCLVREPCNIEEIPYRIVIHIITCIQSTLLYNEYDKSNLFNVSEIPGRFVMFTVIRQEDYWNIRLEAISIPAMEDVIKK